MADVITTLDIKRLLTERHKLSKGNDCSQWVLLFELNNGTGFNGGNNYLDAFAMNAWPSKGYTRVAYEIKVSRGDFTRELDNPGKRSWGMDISNEFWFVCAPDIAKPEEIPESCGLLVATKNGDKLRVVKRPTYRECRELKPTEVASIVRNSFDRDIYKGVYWRYAGKELAKGELQEIIKSERSRHEEEEFEVRVDNAVNTKMEKVYKAMNLYANELKEAGVSPPAWMLKEQSSYWSPSEWDARRWVKDHVSPGPNMSAVDRAQTACQQALKELEHAHNHLSELSNQQLQQEVSA